MGNFQLTISLLLIVAGTAAVLGSSAKQEPPQISPKSQEDERLPSNLNDYENKMDNGTAKQTIIGEIGAARGIAATLAGALKTERTVTISVQNNSGKEWEAKNIYFRSGATDDVIPPTVPTDETLKIRVRKRIPSPYGVSGVTAYYIKDFDKTLAIMFKVPNVAQQIRNNLWNVALRDGEVRADRDMYKKMYKNSYKGDNGWHKKLGLMAIAGDPPYKINIKGSMTNSDKAALQIEVSHQE